MTDDQESLEQVTRGEPPYIHDTADVESGADVGDGVQVWALAHIRDGARVGSQSIVGRGVYVGPGVIIGPRVKIQNYALVYEPAVIHEGAFIGPGAILTNDYWPRAILPDGRLKTGADWTALSVEIGRGASIGAGAVCVAPVCIGDWAMVAAGSVVTSDVPSYALVAGVPAKRIGWVGPSGERLTRGSGVNEWVCPVTNNRFRESGSELVAL